jgi:TorA maturation chaperone TorD
VLSDTSQAPDHITTELHVMSYLCSIEADNWEAERTELAMEALHSQAAFLKRHLAVWVPPFAANARTAGAKGFYGHLIDLLHAFVVHEADYVHGVARRTTPR